MDIDQLYQNAQEASILANASYERYRQAKAVWEADNDLADDAWELYYESLEYGV